MRWLVLLAFACAAGCIRGSNGFHCASDTACAGAGAGAVCEATGYCSFGDASCASGSRYGPLSGPYAGQCVGTVDAGVDTMQPLPDAPDAPPGVPDFLSESHTFGVKVDNLHYMLNIPSGSTNRYLIVVVSIPSDCLATSMTTEVTGITYDAVALAPVKTLLGTACSPQSTRMEQWALVAPHEGQHEVAVQLAAPAQYTVHSGALAFYGVNQMNPVRATAALGGKGAASSIDVTSMTNDLVVNTVGHGNGIGSTQQNIRYLQNVDGSNTLNNSAASTAVATDKMTTMAWTFVGDDEWQTMSTTLRP